MIDSTLRYTWVRSSRLNFLLLTSQSNISLTDHCIDWLRNAVMCHADISALAVFKWDQGPQPFLNTKRVPHMCVDWDRLILSHKERMVSHEEVAAMQNPHAPGEKL